MEKIQLPLSIEVQGDGGVYRVIANRQLNLPLLVPWLAKLLNVLTAEKVLIVHFHFEDVHGCASCTCRALVDPLVPHEQVMGVIPKINALVPALVDALGLKGAKDPVHTH